MGKAQSKRSVDITTDPKKDGIIEEGTGEMKKIEDVDQVKPQVNGDTHHNEEEKEKTAEATGETENEKDLSTEKEQSKPQTSVEGAGGDVPELAAAALPVENGDETLDDSKTAGAAATDTSTTTETPESSKKSKKEKVKKKWSFRSISFGKKDKQKPSKKEEANTSAVNGECEKVPEETTEEPAGEKKEEIVVVADAAAAAESTTATDEKPAVAVVVSEASKDETIAADDKVEEKPTDVVAIQPVVIDAAPVTNGTTTVESPTKIDEIIEGVAAVTIDKIDEIPVVETEANDMKKLEEESAPSVVVVEATAAANEITTNGNKHDDIELVKQSNGDEAAAVPITTDDVTAAPKLNGSTESPKIEENGVGDHAETSATESLNGVEHKTIEEMKAENQIEKVASAEVTQEPAAVAE